MTELILSGSLLYLILLIIALVVFAFMWIALIIRAAINNDLSQKAKIFWILAMMLFAPVALLYALTEKSKLWKTYAVINILLLIPVVGLALFKNTFSSPSAEVFESNQTQNNAYGPNSELQKLSEKIKILKDKNKKEIAYTGVDIQLLSWEMEISSGKTTIEKIMPHIRSLEAYISDNVFTGEEYLKWHEEIKAAK